MLKYIIAYGWAFVVLVPVVGKTQVCCNAGALSTCGNAAFMTGLKNSVAGARYLGAPFRSVTVLPEESFSDHFHVAEVFIRYQISDHLKIQFQQPWRYNKRRFAGYSHSLQGMGDTRVAILYALFDKIEGINNNTFYWEVGAGVKLPVGYYDRSIYFRDLPGNLNPGMGNWGWQLLSNAVVLKNKMGFICSIASQVNSQSRDGYRYGSQLSIVAGTFREWPVARQLNVVPTAGLMGEWFGQNHKPSGKPADGSGGSALFLQTACFMRWNAFQLGTQVHVPMAQHYAQSRIKARCRWVAEALFFF